MAEGRRARRRAAIVLDGVCGLAGADSLARLGVLCMRSDAGVGRPSKRAASAADLGVTMGRAMSAAAALPPTPKYSRKALERGADKALH